MVYVKIHHSGDSSILAVCDEDLIGKTLTQGNLAVFVSPRFYHGETKPEEGVIILMQSSANINILGKKSIEIALKAKVINKDSIIMIEGVPHAQVVA